MSREDELNSVEVSTGKTRMFKFEPEDSEASQLWTYTELFSDERTVKQIEYMSYHAYEILDHSQVIDINEVNEEEWDMPERELYLVTAAYCSH